MAVTVILCTGLDEDGVLLKGVAFPVCTESGQKALGICALGARENPMACQWPPGDVTEVCGKRQHFGMGWGLSSFPGGFPGH